jgi:phosphoglycerate dehydrogenase-like enzyme/glyoxylase-like metal-dependent hydrolase (beta-lactamase superfamily II)
MTRCRLRRSLLLALPIVAGAIGAHAALFRKAPETRPNQVAELAPGVYFRHGDLEGHGHCNNGIVLFKDFVLVIDANFPSGADACIADIKKLTDKPIRFVFDTHHHGDHAYGNPTWAKHGVIPVAHEGVAREMARYEPKRWLEAAESRDDVKKLGLDSAMPPVLTYPDRMVIDDGTQRVELLHFGTAHTRGDGFAYLPKQKVLFTGDAVVNGPYNYMGDGQTESWVRVIERLEELDVDIVAPGHGPAGDRSVLARQKDYIQALQRAVREGIAQGRSAAELRDSVKVPEALQSYVGGMFRDQVTKVYSEATGLELPLELEELGLVPGDSPTRASAGWTAPRKVVISGPAEWRKDLAHVAPGVELAFAANRRELLAAIADAEGLIGPLDAELFGAAKKLRWVHSVSAGVNQYVGIEGAEAGVAGLAASSVVLTNGRRCYGPDIGDQVFGYVLAFSRWLKASVEGKHDIAAGKVSPAAGAGGAGNFWRAIDPGSAKAEWELRGKSMLIVGLGGIGSEVARRAKAFGMTVAGVDPDVASPPAGVGRLRRPAEILDLLPEADVVVIACPWTRATHRFFGERHFAAMKPKSILVNVARGAIVDPKSLVDALKGGKLLGAGLDVTDPEPLPDDDPLWSLPNVIITPHNAGQSDGVTRRRLLLARENLRRFAAGEPLLNVVDKQKGY